MVKEYIPFSKNQNNEFKTLKPNIKKIFSKNIFSVVGAVLLIIIVLSVVNWFFGLDIFLAPFETWDVSINPSKILLYAILTIVAVTIFLLIGNYLVTRNVRYEFYQDKLILYKNLFLIFIKSKEIPYQNITKISYNNDSIFNKIFNSGTIVLDLSGMKESKVELEFIDNVTENVKYIQGIVQEFKSIQQAKFTEDYKIGEILGKY